MFECLEGLRWLLHRAGLFWWEPLARLDAARRDGCVLRVACGRVWRRRRVAGRAGKAGFGGGGGREFCGGVGGGLLGALGMLGGIGGKMLGAVSRALFCPGGGALSGASATWVAV